MRAFFKVYLVLTALLVFSCKKNVETGMPDGAASARTPVEISYWYPLNAGSGTQDDLVGLGMDKLMELSGVKINWIVVPAVNAIDQFNILFAAGDLPDVVAYNVSGLHQYTQAFMTVDDIIKGDKARYPSMNKYFFDSGDEYLQNYLSSDDDHWRIIPMLATRRIGDMLIVRQDLLDKYGIDPPSTAEEWENAFRLAKADGKVPYMTRMNREGILFRLLGGYVDCVIEDYFVEDGKVKYGVLDPRLKEGVELARKWYTEGLIDREYPSTDSTKMTEELRRGDVFATHNNLMILLTTDRAFEEAGFPYKVMGVGPMVSPRTGERHTPIHYPRVRDKSSSIAKTTKVDPKRILDWFETCFSDEGFILCNYGIEGISFNYVNGDPLPDPTYSSKLERGELPRVASTMDMPKLQRDELLVDYNDTRIEGNNAVRAARDLYSNNPDWIVTNYIASLNFTDEERAVLSPINAELTTYRGEMLDKFIMGIEPMSNWDRFTAQIQRMQLDIALQIYQSALDRLLN
jgi:putative aldouronate transport system substrate-binding protein